MKPKNSYVPASWLLNVYVIWLEMGWKMKNTLQTMRKKKILSQLTSGER